MAEFVEPILISAIDKHVTRPDFVAVDGVGDNDPWGGWQQFPRLARAICGCRHFVKAQEHAEHRIAQKTPVSRIRSDSLRGTIYKRFPVNSRLPGGIEIGICPKPSERDSSISLTFGSRGSGNSFSQ